MRNVLRLETKGCQSKRDEVWWGASVGEGKGAYVIFLIRGVLKERVWGIPWEIPEA